MLDPKSEREANTMYACPGSKIYEDKGLRSGTRVREQGRKISVKDGVKRLLKQLLMPHFPDAFDVDSDLIYIDI